MASEFERQRCGAVRTVMHKRKVQIIDRDQDGERSEWNTFSLLGAKRTNIMGRSISKPRTLIEVIETNSITLLQVTQSVQFAQSENYLIWFQ